MTKIGAIARYEVLMAWRRRSLPILWLLLFVGVVGFTLLWQSANSQLGVSLTEQLARQASLPEYMINTIPMLSILFGGMLIFSVGISVMLTEVVPLDRQFKVYELLNALPITRAVYLGGKVLSVWVGLTVGWALVGVVCAACLYLIFGAYDLRVIALVWLVGLLPTTLVASAISVLIGSLVGSRRIALLLGLAALPFITVLMASTIPSFFNIGTLINPLYVVNAPILRTVSAAEVINAVLASLLLYAGVTSAVWTLVWAWTRLREAR